MCSRACMYSRVGACAHARACVSVDAFFFLNSGSERENEIILSVERPS